MNNLTYESKLFLSMNEPYAAGLFEEPNESYIRRFCRAERRYWEKRSLPVYDGGKLYPCGYKFTDQYAVVPSFTYTYDINLNALPDEAQTIMRSLPSPRMVSSPHTVGGNGYIHSIPNYARVAREGLNSYRDRINQSPDADFKAALNDVIDGITAFHTKTVDYLTEIGAEDKLTDALRKVPFHPAETLYEALVCWNFLYYLDGCDDPGRLDADLAEWYRGEDVTDILREFFRHVDINDGWTAALGPDYNPLTLQCLEAIRGIRRPNLELRVTPDMPDEVWNYAEEAIKSGGGQPSFYNEPLYQSALREKFPDKSQDDLIRFCGGGCTETMLAGISNVGSLDAGINLALIFRKYMENNISVSQNFDSFLDGFTEEVRKTVKTVTDEISIMQSDRSIMRSQPMRTLLIDDCIDRSLDFLNGGARHCWSVVNIAGLINVIDSMLAIRHLVFEQGRYSANDFVSILDSGDEELYRNIKNCPSYGNDDESADTFASHLTKEIYSAFEDKTPYLGGAFLPSSIQFATYTDAGRWIDATPDGRKKGDPLCDSISAIHGNDKNGCVAMLNSAASLPLDMALGTPVMNLSVSKSHVSGHLRHLIKGFFASGGMQLQITCQSKKDMIDAAEHPELYPNLIVRIGGYSEYFSRLTPSLRQTVIERSEY